MTTVFHISPKSDINRVSPRVGTQSVRQGKPGIYVAPTFKDAIAWGASFVAHKRKPDNYSSLTIYTLRLPKSVIDNAWSSQSWEKEYFIPDDQLEGMDVVGRQTMTFSELMKIYNRHSQATYELRDKKANLEKIAMSLQRTNLAARYFLQLKEMGRELALKRRSIELKSVEDRAKALIPYFAEHDFLEVKPLARLQPGQEMEVKKLVSGLIAA